MCPVLGIFEKKKIFIVQLIVDRSLESYLEVQKGLSVLRKHIFEVAELQIMLNEWSEIKIDKRNKSFKECMK